jgi:hypothetical protein
MCLRGTPKGQARSARRRLGLGLILVLVAAAIGACRDESSALRSQNSALRTEVAQPSETASAAPAPDIVEFCRATREFRFKREALIARFNQINATDDFFGSVTGREEQELLELEGAARGIRVALPSQGVSDQLSRMNTLVLTLKAADERFITAIRTDDYAAHQSAREDANAAGEELHQLFDASCP